MAAMNDTFKNSTRVGARKEKVHTTRELREKKINTPRDDRFDLFRRENTRGKAAQVQKLVGRVSKRK